MISNEEVLLRISEVMRIHNKILPGLSQEEIEQKRIQAIEKIRRIVNEK